MFSHEDLKQFAGKNISMDTVERQLHYFRTGFPFLHLDRAATAGDGIRILADKEAARLIQQYDTKRGKQKIFKFVPASGAATRMFKDLYELMRADGKKESPALDEIFSRLGDLALCNSLKQIMDSRNIALTDRVQIAAAILLPDGLNCGNLPKGMLMFHKYDDGVRTALEEHLAEGASYAANTDGSVNLHFTVSPEHQLEFRKLVDSKLDKYSTLYHVHYNVSFSQQKPSTDIFAVDSNNRPVRNADGSILFRPGGHGALLENLNETDADIIFIKNIDNVVPDRLKPVTVKYKKALAGLLMELHAQTVEYHRLLRDGQCGDALINEILYFLTEQLSFRPPVTLSSCTAEGIKAYLISVLHRPIRVCGMVRNEGEPGGGPFWVRNSDGSCSLQIAEMSQIDMNDPQQKEVSEAAAYFNPVDLVCAVKDGDGRHFNLPEYRDPDTGFISRKYKDGVELKAQELPGLWNGAMAHWNTVFVEVPIETFNPVKTITDLLRPQHQ